MKKIYFLILVLCNSFFFSQEKINPFKEISYGNKNHTNRDVLKFTIKDSNNNFYLIGTTENDFTFNDGKIIKLNSNLDVIWEKEKSFDTGLSYDGILGVHIDSNDDLIIIFRAAYTSNRQTFILTKLDKHGNFLWEHALSDLNDPIAYDSSSFKSFIDSSNNVSFIFKPINETPVNFYFKKISPSGEVLSEFSTNQPFIASDGSNRISKIINIDDIYYAISSEDIASFPYQKFIFQHFTNSIYSSSELDLTDEAISFFRQSFAEEYSVIKKDNSNNILLLVPNYDNNKNFGLLNVDLNGEIKYVILPEDSVNKYPLEFGFDEQNNLLIVSNNALSSDANNLKVTLQKYDEDGNLFFEKDSPYNAKFASINNGQVSILTDGNKIINYDHNFDVLDNIQLNQIATSEFQIIDLLKTEEETFLSGFTKDINYSGSVLISETDMLIKKANHSDELTSYRYSGKGTSKVFMRNELVVRDTAYAFAVTEATGPDNFGPGGSISPRQQRFVTLNKSDLSILEDKIVPTDEILYTPIYPKDLSTSFISNNGDNYIYEISSDTTNISLFKNNVFQWSRDLNLYEDPNGDGITNDDELIMDWKVNNKGDFLLSTYIYGLNEFTIHKFSLNNEYLSLELNQLIPIIQPFTNNWIFTMNYQGEIVIYSDRLTVINSPDSEYRNIGIFSFYVKEKNNQLLFHNYRDQYIYVFNKFGEMLPNYFEINTSISLDSDVNVEYDDQYLLTLESVGSSLYLNPEYAWQRAILKKFDLDVTDSFDEISLDDDDQDGVPNNIDECRNTPSNETPDQYGCSQSQVLSISDISLYKTTIYPNPSTGIFYFNNASSKIKKISVFDTLGREIYSNNRKSYIENGKIDLNKQDKGVYFIRFLLENNASIDRKIVLLK
ncbi:T9SS type A sorting domain-containing protein [Tenacibaculum xiamenense]|uniref:T9SS type A sorting domain-containing protein n=1 Tax=Tenacibaculum xiamenense TaxID=1261553 RepID=UPI003895465D